MTEEHRSDGRSIDEILAEARAELDKTPDEPQNRGRRSRTILRRISATRSMTTANSRSRSPRRSFLRSRPASATSASCRCS